jgi:hypothetical protein
MRPRLGYSARTWRVSADNLPLTVGKTLLTKVGRHSDTQLPTAIGLEFGLGNGSRHTLCYGILIQEAIREAFSARPEILLKTLKKSIF